MTSEVIGWYESAAYQEILPLRTSNIDGATLIVDGVPEGYDARSTAAVLRQLLPAND